MKNLRWIILSIYTVKMYLGLELWFQTLNRYKICLFCFMTRICCSRMKDILLGFSETVVRKTLHREQSFVLFFNNGLFQQQSKSGSILNYFCVKGIKIFSPSLYIEFECESQASLILKQGCYNRRWEWIRN